MLPLIFDFLHGRESSLLIKCVSPPDCIDGRPGSEVLLNGFKVYVDMWMILMVDQVAKYSSMGLRCTCICG